MAVTVISVLTAVFASAYARSQVIDCIRVPMTSEQIYNLAGDPDERGVDCDGNDYWAYRPGLVTAGFAVKFDGDGRVAIKPKSQRAGIINRYP